jgi:hypothetical protein
MKYIHKYIENMTLFMRVYGKFSYAIRTKATSTFNCWIAAHGMVNLTVVKEESALISQQLRALPRESCPL